jgi:hypothetical protein
VATEAAGKHARRFDRRRLAQVREDDNRPDLETPLPALPSGVVLGVGDDVHDGEEHLPTGRITDRGVAELDGRSARRRMRPQVVRPHLVRKAPVASASHE